MKIDEALSALGVNRVIWIDDHFNDTPNQLSDLLCNNIEITRQCEFGEFEEVIEQFEFNEEGVRNQITQILTDLSRERRFSIKEEYFAQEKRKLDMPTDEIGGAEFDFLCRLMNVKDDDRWTFDDYESQLPKICSADDSSVSYIIDLRDGAAHPTRGLDVLVALNKLSSKGTAFILTHEASIDKEETLECELRDALCKSHSALSIPVCVIAKQRLYSESGEEEELHNSLRIAIKRAGLKKSMHEVLAYVSSNVRSMFDEAASTLLDIPPEQLEAFVVERGRKEGVSELHVVERAVSVTLAQKIRDVFAKSDSVQKSTRRLRALRTVPLTAPVSQIHKSLHEFRSLEVWEHDTLINGAYTPIACGDVFELDELEFPGENSRKFLLLAQPCDISIRDNGKRDLEMAFLVPLKEKEAAIREKEKLKETPLQFRIDGVQYVCDLRAAVSARLSILDLSSSRADGRVRLDKLQEETENLLPGLQIALEKGRRPIAKLLDQYSSGKLKLSGGGDELIHPSMQLTMLYNGPIKKIHSGKYKKASTVCLDGMEHDLPDRITWGLRRCGRIRMPYAASLLKDYMTVMSREAFDLDFTWLEPASCVLGEDSAGVPGC
nr:hypothetical protein [uncultured Pseudomonas sp.]